MNRNRFSNPPPNYNDNKTNPLNFTSPVPRFNAWQNNLPINQNVQPVYPIPQTKKNYCSTCDLWTIEPYNTHQISAAHIAKKTAQRISQNYPSLYPNINSNTPNNSNINNNNQKRKYKKTKPRGSNSQKVNKHSNNAESIEPTLQYDVDSILPEEISQSTEIDANIKSDSISQNDDIKGLEMLIPVSGVFCALCEMFFANKDEAENDHCSSESHCQAYENLLQKVQNAKQEKRSIENTSEMNEAKRMKLADNSDDDLSSLIDNECKSKIEIKSTTRESDEADKISTGDLMAPDFSLEFPDDLEDYDEGEIRSSSNMSSPVDKGD